jgi:hypothetical protein
MRRKTSRRTPAKIVHVEEVSQETLRLRFIFKQRKEAALYSATAEEWWTEVMRLAGPEPTPQQWVDAAEKATTRCNDCGGSGVYCWGAIINRVPQHSGPCFRCQGKGRQGQADYQRNRHYDNHRRIV